MRSALYPVLFSDPMSQWARDAVHAWDFLKDKARWNRGRVGALANTPGWSYTRADAQTAYAQNAAGVLIPFSTGQLRRTDKGVLIEGARTNLCLQSQTFDNATWTKTGGSVSADAAVAPDGTTTADKFIPTNGTSLGVTTSLVRQDFTKAASATAYAVSIFGQAAGLNRIIIRCQDSGGSTNRADVTVSLVDGSITTAAAVAGSFTSPSAVVQTFANGFYRACLMFTSSTDTFLRLIVAPSDSVITTGDGASGVYLWGAQLE